MRKRFRRKKKLKNKALYLFFFFIITLICLNYLEKNIKLNIPDDSIIYKILKSENKYSQNNDSKLNNDVYLYIKNYVFKTPLNILKNELKFEDKKKEAIAFAYVKNEIPLVYIYNSHQGETYSTKFLENHNIVPNVLMASNMLKEKLENIGINTIVEESDILAYMKKNNLNHAGSYIASRHFLTKAIKKYSDAKLYIDLHRDSITHKLSTTTINGKDYAKILFVIGLEYPTYEKNLKIVTRINDMIKEKYPTLTRGIMKKKGYGVNGVYNQDLASNIILIEVGGNENNIEEINNTLDAVAQILGEYINEKE